MSQVSFVFFLFIPGDIFIEGTITGQDGKIKTPLWRSLSLRIFLKRGKSLSTFVGSFGFQSSRWAFHFQTFGIQKSLKVYIPKNIENVYFRFFSYLLVILFLYFMLASLNSWVSGPSDIYSFWSFAIPFFWASTALCRKSMQGKKKLVLSPFMNKMNTQDH